jgi:hypothetical protein
MIPASKLSLWHNVRRWLPGVIISLVALFVVFHLASFKDLASAFRLIKPLNLVIALVFYVIAFFIRALAWRTLLGNIPSISQCFFIVNEGYLLNNLFPLRAGEIGRAVFMGKAIKVSPFHVLSTIILERAFDLIIAATMLLTTLPIVLGVPWARSAGISTLILMIALVVVLYLMTRNNEKVHAIAQRIGGRWNLFTRFVIPQIDSLLDGLSALKNLRQFLLSIFWIGMTWVFWISVYYIMLLTIAPNAPLWWAFFANAILSLGVAIPSAPAGLGVYEAATVVALAILGIAQPTALAFALIMHFMSFFITGIFGFWGLIRERHSFSSISSEIQLHQVISKE